MNVIFTEQEEQRIFAQSEMEGLQVSIESSCDNCVMMSAFNSKLFI